MAKVFVSGCFDLLHSGHLAFLKSASVFGDLYVSVGSDETIRGLKGRYPVYNENERVALIRELRCVHQAFIAYNKGKLDFIDELYRVKPDIFIVNEDGHDKEKETLCSSLGITYRILKRVPDEGLPIRSSTAIRNTIQIPYRIDLAGGWLDQPYVSQHYPGPVLTISIEPTHEFNLRSGMATSTRNKAIRLFQHSLPNIDHETLAKLLFCYDNPPGTKEIAGSQDALGIILPGLNYLYYTGEYWPTKIQSTFDNTTLSWLESVIQLVQLQPRNNNYAVLDETNINKNNAQQLSIAADNCWKAILAKDIILFGKYVRESFEAQIKMFPRMSSPDIIDRIKTISNLAYGWKLSGAGGGGYIVCISDKEIPNSIKIIIRRPNTL